MSASQSVDSMGNALIAFFNNTFGSNITYIANSYSHADFIWVIFHTQITNFEISFETNGFTPKINTTLRSGDMINQFERIPYGGYLKKKRVTNQEYLTITAKNRNGTEEMICNNKAILANNSFIVTNSCQVIQSKYGGNIWEDEHGNDYFPQ